MDLGLPMTRQAPGRRHRSRVGARPPRSVRGPPGAHLPTSASRTDHAKPTGMCFPPSPRGSSLGCATRAEPTHAVSSRDRGSGDLQSDLRGAPATGGGIEIGPTVDGERWHGGIRTVFREPEPTAGHAAARSTADNRRSFVDHHARDRSAGGLVGNAIGVRKSPWTRAARPGCPPARPGQPLVPLVGAGRAQE